MFFFLADIEDDDVRKRQTSTNRLETYFFPKTDVIKHVAAGIKRSPRRDRITMNL